MDTATLAKYFGVAQRTVRHWAEVKGLPKIAQNTYDLKEIRKWEVGRLKIEIAAQQIDQKRYTKAAADEKEEKALGSRLRRERMEGLLIDRKEIERGWMGKVVAVVSGLEMLARRIAERLDLPEVEKIVEEEVVLCRDRFASREEVEKVMGKKRKKKLEEGMR